MLQLQKKVHLTSHHTFSLSRAVARPQEARVGISKRMSSTFNTNLQRALTVKLSLSSNANAEAHTSAQPDKEK